MSHVASTATALYISLHFFTERVNDLNNLSLEAFQVSPDSPFASHITLHAYTTKTHTYTYKLQANFTLDRKAALFELKFG